MGMTSCLKQNDMNIDPEDTSGRIVTLQFLKEGGTTINSGLNYFANAALTYPASHTSDTAIYNVALAGGTALDRDLTVTVDVDPSKVLDYYYKDSIAYELMPDSLYEFLGTSATIPAGSAIAQLKLVFFPSKMDPSKSYMLPVVVKDAGGQTISGNYGTIYYHVIGNPIAGSYLWDFYRYNNQDGTGSPTTTWTDEPTVFAPVNPTSIKVPTGYYTTPNYLITFKNNNGVLSDFKAVIAPDEIEEKFTKDGITVVSGPTITVSPDLKTFTVKYVVFNGAAYRNLTDIYRR